MGQVWMKFGSLPPSHARTPMTQVVSMEAGADFPESNHEAMADMVSRGEGMENCDSLNLQMFLWSCNKHPSAEMLQENFPLT